MKRGVGWVGGGWTGIKNFVPKENGPENEWGGRWSCDYPNDIWSTFVALRLATSSQDVLMEI